MVEEEPEYGDAQLMTWNPHVVSLETSVRVRRSRVLSVYYAT